MPHLPNRAWSCQSVWLPWVERLASAWLLGKPIAVAPEDQPAVEAAARELVAEALARAIRRCA